MSKRDDRPGGPSPAKRGHRPTGDVEGRKNTAPKRIWPKHKTEAVLRLLKGEDIEHLSRELGVTAVTPTEWRELFLAGCAEAFKKRPAKEEAELKRLN